jgi:hypothetical protein
MYDLCYDFRTKLIHPWHGDYYGDYGAEYIWVKWESRFFASLLSFRLRAYDLISIGFSLPGIALSRRMYSIARQ